MLQPRRKVLPPNEICPLLNTGYDCHESPQFILHIGGICDGGGHFLPQDFAKAAAHAEDRHGHRGGLVFN